MNTNQHFINNILWTITEITVNTLEEINNAIVTGKNCEIIRMGSYRKVLKYTSNNEVFYVKQYTNKNITDAIKSSFLTSKAKKEWHQSQLLIKSPFLTAKPVAIGESRRWGILKNCYIITKAIPNSKTLRELLIDMQPFSTDNKLSTRNKLLNNLISYVKTMHDNGLLHGELHAENILVDNDNLSLFYLLDLGRLRLKRQWSKLMRINELARLFYSIMNFFTENEIINEINNYTRRESTPKDMEVFQKGVIEEIQRIKHRLWRSRTGQCLKTNTVFKEIKHGRYSINMLKEWDVDLLISLLDKHSIYLKEKHGNIIKISHKTCVTLVPLPNKANRSICIKEYKYRSFLKQFLYSLFPSPARMAWFSAYGLITLNITTPKPIALIEEKGRGATKRSFVIMEDVSVCVLCNKYVIEKFGSLCNEVTLKKKKRFIAHLALSFRRLHESNIYHGDLKANNIMIMDLQDCWDFIYLDLDRIYFNKKITLKRKIKNLSQLNASIPNCITYADRLRFYRVYAGVKNLSGEDKQILRIIIQLSIYRRHIWNPKK